MVPTAATPGITVVANQNTGPRLDYGITGPFVLVVRGSSKTYDQLDSHALHLVDAGRILETIPSVVSGNSKVQVYLPKSNPGPPGSLRPLPEGIYTLGAPQRGTGAPGIGPWFVPIIPDPRPRSLFGVHLDENRSSGPGTAGCVGLPDGRALDAFMAWMRRSTPPGRIVVNWNLGTLGSGGGMALALAEEPSRGGARAPTAEERENARDPRTGEILN